MDGDRQENPVVGTKPVPLMTPQEVADFLGMPVATLQVWRARRTGPRAYRVGKHVRYASEDVLTWLEKRRSG
jgi:excisionase family DNA binding protein